MDQLKGQNAIVFGCGEIARGIATRFAREGAAIVVAADDETEGTRSVEAIEAEGAQGQFICVDTGDADAIADSVNSAIKELGQIHVLVNAVETRTKPGPLHAKPQADFSQLLNGDVMTALLSMQAIYPHMKANGGGRIVNVGSVYGANAYVHLADSTTRDFALQGLTRSAACEWAQDQILVNYLAPGIADVSEFREYRNNHPEMVDRLIKNTPLQRLMDPVEDIGGVAMFLVSDEACFIVGHPIYADGGQHLVAPVMEPGTGS